MDRIGGIIDQNQISLGPAMESISTSPKTMRLAVATKIFPGPTILSTLGIVRVPKAIAATACAPPMRKIRLTPARCAAARRMEPSAPRGEVMMISSTPATLAGIAFMSTVDGYSALPPGT
jgi:hypothetical protein